MGTTEEGDNGPSHTLSTKSSPNSKRSHLTKGLSWKPSLEKERHGVNVNCSCPALPSHLQLALEPTSQWLSILTHPPKPQLRFLALWHWEMPALSRSSSSSSTGQQRLTQMVTSSWARLPSPSWSPWTPNLQLALPYSRDLLRVPLQVQHGPPLGHLNSVTWQVSVNLMTLSSNWWLRGASPAQTFLLTAFIFKSCWDGYQTVKWARHSCRF